jgi:hypothetical protein
MDIFSFSFFFKKKEEMSKLTANIFFSWSWDKDDDCANSSCDSFKKALFEKLQNMFLQVDFKERSLKSSSNKPLRTAFHVNIVVTRNLLKNFNQELFFLRNFERWVEKNSEKSSYLVINQDSPSTTIVNDSMIHFLLYKYEKENVKKKYEFFTSGQGDVFSKKDPVGFHLIHLFDENTPDTTPDMVESNELAFFGISRWMFRNYGNNNPALFFPLKRKFYTDLLNRNYLKIFENTVLEAFQDKETPSGVVLVRKTKMDKLEKDSPFLFEEEKNPLDFEEIYTSGNFYSVPMSEDLGASLIYYERFKRVSIVNTSKPQASFSPFPSSSSNFEQTPSSTFMDNIMGGPDYLIPLEEGSGLRDDPNYSVSKRDRKESSGPGPKKLRISDSIEFLQKKQRIQDSIEFLQKRIGELMNELSLDEE